MKIAYFCAEYPPRVYDGLGVYVDSISRELAALGNTVSIFTIGGSGLKRREGRKGIRVFREVPLPMNDGLKPFLSAETSEPLVDLLSYNQLAVAKLRDEGPYDLCVAHDWFGLPGVMAAKRAGVPMIFHIHSTDVGRSDQPNQQLISLEMRGTDLADAVMTVSHAMLEHLVRLGVPTEKIYFCYQGVDTKAFSPDSLNPDLMEKLRKSYGIAEGDEVVLFLGRLEQAKGVIQLMKAIPLIREKHPNVKFLIIGKGILEGRMRQEAERLGSVVRFITELMDQPMKVQHYGIADLCVFPSLYEPFGIEALEAAAIGKPSVVGARGVSGLREIVENQDAPRPTGIHINGWDPKDIAWGVDMALDDPERLKQWGRNARERCTNDFTWRKAAERTLEIYQEVLAR